MKFVVTGSSIYYAYYIYEVFKKQNLLFWCLVSIAILFNPIILIYLRYKTLWGFIDIIVILFFIIMMFKLIKNRNKL